MWNTKGPRLSLGELSTVEAQTEGLVRAIEETLSSHYRQTRKCNIEHPSDVAAYLTLHEVDEKAIMETTAHRLKAIDFGVKALSSGRK